MSDKDKQKKEQRIISQFMADFDLAATAEDENRREMIEDLEFAALKQWDESLLQKRKDRPNLTLDRVGQPIRKVAGNIRTNMPQIKFDPQDDNADPDTAEVLTGLARQIQQSSNSASVYMTGANTLIKCGYGVWRVVTVENQDDIFSQDIKLIREKNPLAWYFDPDANNPQKDDGRFCIKSGFISEEEFKKKYKAEVPASIPVQHVGQDMERWYAQDSVRIGEYWVKEQKKATLTQLSDGSVVEADSITDEDIELYRAQGIEPVRNREVKKDIIKYYKLTAFSIIEESEWPSRYFPGIPVYGVEENIDGKTSYRGIVRAAKDPQRMYNYWNSAAAETIALQPKAPWLATHEQIKNYRGLWDRANIDNLPYLVYDPDGEAPPPQRIAPPALQSGLLQQAQLSADDIQQATGVFEASVGALPQQRSGVAVEALQAEADLGTSLYMDSMISGVEHTGRVILDLIPKIYDTERIVRIRGEDDVSKFVEINKPMLTPGGLKIQNDLTRGKYDVIASAGASYKTRRKEAAASIVELGRVFPQVMQVAGDLVAKNLDWPGADEIAERLKKLLPPGIADDEDMTDEERQAVAQAQQQQKAMQQQAIQLEMAEKQSEIENKAADTVKKLSEAEQNDIENAVQIAELAANQENQVLMAQALQNVVALIRSAGNQNLQSQPIL